MSPVGTLRSSMWGYVSLGVQHLQMHGTALADEMVLREHPSQFMVTTDVTAGRR